MTGRENRTVTLLYWPVAFCERSRLRCCTAPMPMPMRGGCCQPGTGRFSVCTLYSVINSIYLRPVQRRVHPCRNLSVCRASLSPARLVANSRPFRNREKPSILITRAVVRRFKTPLHDSLPSCRPPPLSSFPFRLTSTLSLSLSLCARVSRFFTIINI